MPLAMAFCRSPCPGTQHLPVCKDAVSDGKEATEEKGYWTRQWILRRPQFGLYDQLLVELSNEDQAAFKTFVPMPPEMYDKILARVEHRIQKQYTWFLQASTARSLHHSETSGVRIQVCGYAYECGAFWT